MTVEEFLKLGDLTRDHDMKLEYANGALGKTEDFIERFIVYKASAQYGSVYQDGAAFSDAVRQEYPGLLKYDCDRCCLMLQVYRLLWKDAIEEMEQSQISGELGDTMTSFQSALNLTIKEADKNLPFLLKVQGYYSQKYCTALLARKEEGLLSRLKQDCGLQEFAKYVHTIGNFIPVPEGVNCARAGRNGQHDCWDLALMKIKEWYDAAGNKEEQDKILRQFLHDAKDEVIETCKKWLGYYETWGRFIEKNYLQDFVEGDAPIPFCKGHSWDQPRPEDLSAFYKTAAELIAARGKRMAAELQTGEGN